MIDKFKLELKTYLLEEHRRNVVIAAAAGLIAFIILVGFMNMGALLGLLLAAGIVIGVYLFMTPPALRNGKQGEGDDDVQDEPRELVVLEQSRAASAQIRANLPHYDNSADRESVGAIVDQIDKQLNAMTEDTATRPEKLEAAPLYHAQYVRPIADYLNNVVLLIDREVTFNRKSLRRTLGNVLRAARLFYQEYHASIILDMRTLEQIIKNIIDDLDQDDLFEEDNDDEYGEHASDDLDDQEPSDSDSGNHSDTAPDDKQSSSEHDLGGPVELDDSELPGADEVDERSNGRSVADRQHGTTRKKENS